MRKIALLLLLATGLAAFAQPEAGKTYCIVSKKFDGMHISEEQDGSLVVGTSDITKRQFWAFDVADAAKGTFYIRNIATGRYIESCNKEPNSSSKIKTQAERVEYYVGKATAGDNAGYYWMSSTDCANYNDYTQSPRGLNKDGASNHIITWYAGPTNAGSFWKIEETTDAFEVRPFEPSERIGKPGICYHLTTHGGDYVAMDGTLKPAAEGAELSWYFVGTSNTSGYEIVNLKNHQSLTAQNGQKKWAVSEVIEGAETRYAFTTLEGGEKLTIDGENSFTLRTARSAVALSRQIYNNPCGQRSGQYFAAVNINEGDAVVKTLTYPIRTKTLNSSTTQTVSPTSWYTISVLDKPILARGGKFTMKMTLQKTLQTSENVFAYFDWNRDGVFETCVQPTGENKAWEIEAEVPEDAKLGNSRIRLRVTENGLSDAEDDVIGQVLDFATEVVEKPQHEAQLFVTVNNPLRGKAEWANDTLTATVYGRSTFFCWKEDKRVLGVSKRLYMPTPTHDRHIVAYFLADRNDPYGDDVLSGIEKVSGKIEGDDNVLVELEAAGRRLQATAGSAKILGLMVYNMGGQLVAHSKSDCIEVSHLPRATYVVRVLTSKKHQSAKVMVR